jgi:hypothetical protein
MNTLQANRPTSLNEAIQNLKRWRVPLPGGLQQQAFDVLSITASSGEVEHLFSSRCLLVTRSWSALRNEAIEQAQCLKQWFRTGLIALPVINIPDEQQVKEELPVDLALTRLLDDIFDAEQQQQHSGSSEYSRGERFLVQSATQ